MKIIYLLPQCGKNIWTLIREKKIKKLNMYLDIKIFV